MIRCGRCGTELPPWFDALDDEHDEARYQRWLVTPCERCGARPEEFCGTAPGVAYRQVGSQPAARV